LKTIDIVKVLAVVKGLMSLTEVLGLSEEELLRELLSCGAYVTVPKSWAELWEDAGAIPDPGDTVNVWVKRVRSLKRTYDFKLWYRNYMSRPGFTVVSATSYNVMTFRVATLEDVCVVFDIYFKGSRLKTFLKDYVKLFTEGMKRVVKECRRSGCGKLRADQNIITALLELRSILKGTAPPEILELLKSLTAVRNDDG
jgi:hypothetical protein